MISSRDERARWCDVDNGSAYSIHLYAGMLPRTNRIKIAGRARSGFIDNVDLIDKLRFTRPCLPVMDNFVSVAWLQTMVRSLP
ncbi:hypothetical protein [Burkholderia ambifaria]|uniref:hypothetical protein n=1 Tax=Burkholderia ambifaria TaxID=152480 RepID=UPI00158F3735|nr:hypothetical protein [Burkholderia ambifaria]